MGLILLPLFIIYTLLGLVSLGIINEVRNSGKWGEELKLGRYLGIIFALIVFFIKLEFLEKVLLLTIGFGLIPILIYLVSKIIEYFLKKPLLLMNRNLGEIFGVGTGTCFTIVIIYIGVALIIDFLF